MRLRSLELPTEPQKKAPKSPIQKEPSLTFHIYSYDVFFKKKQKQAGKYLNGDTCHECLIHLLMRCGENVWVINSESTLRLGFPS